MSLVKKMIWLWLGVAESAKRVKVRQVLSCQNLVDFSSTDFSLAIVVQESVVELYYLFFPIKFSCQQCMLYCFLADLL